MYCINYVIKQGDSLYKISREYNVSINDLMNANPLINVYRLQVGEVICIPVSIPQNNYTNFTTYLIEEEDTLGSILDKNGINLADLMEFNALHDIYLLPGTTLQVPIIGTGESGITL
jgi:LysM repeat protein